MKVPSTKWILPALLICFVCSSVFIQDSMAQNARYTGDENDAQSRCMPTGPPPENGYEPYLGAMASPGMKVIGGVPGYLWRHGCGPTANGMVIGYWDRNGFPLLIPGNSATQTDAVNQAIASGNGANTHYSDYCLPMDAPPGPIEPDLSEPPSGDEHPNNCLADYFKTSFSYYNNYYGWSWFSYADNAFSGYVGYVNSTYGASYSVSTWNEIWGIFTWSDLQNEIDNDNPVCLLVDTDADGTTDHFVTAIGYRDTYGYNEYACLDTWDPVGQIRWQRFREMGVGITWGVYGATYFHISGPALDPPVITAVDPESGHVGATLTVGISGSDFVDGCDVDFGEGITINYTVDVSSDSFSANITIDPAAVPGQRDVTVYNSLTLSDVLVDGFEVLGTPVHYVSPTGNNISPYATPDDAAHVLTDAIAAAEEEDSVLVASTTYNNFTISISKGVEIYGAWTGNFTGRDLETGKTLLNMNGNIKINASGGVFDGFIIDSGSGDYTTMPQPGYYGGGVWVYQCTTMVSNCEIRSCQAGVAPNYTAGGGISAYNSTVDLHDNYIWGNSAEDGGGIYLYNSSCIIEDNIIADNQIQQMASTPYGAGLCILDTPDASLDGNSITGNTGASDGGGMYVNNVANIDVSGGLLSYNQSTSSGGGVTLLGTDATFDGVRFLRNSAGIFGGAISASNTSAVTVQSCNLEWNSAIIGGGIYANAGEAHIRHNLFVGNNASSSTGGCYAASLTDGIFLGNTLDRNSTGTGAGGVYLLNSGIDVFNNIVVNSQGAGIACAGSPLPTLRYNDVWNSSGSDYDGCSPGEGSISADPLFSDTSAVDYHLAVHSPAIDAGDTSGTYDDPDGSRGDMGRYGSHSFAMDQPCYPKNLTASVVSGNIILSWDKNPETDMQSYAIYGDSNSGFVPSIDKFIQFVSAPDTSVDLGAYSDTVYYCISAVDTSGYGSGYSNEVLPIPTAVPGEPIAYSTMLYQNCPNPFNPTTRIKYELEYRMDVSLTVYDVRGRLIKQLVKAQQGPGVFSSVWDGTNISGEYVSSGIYFYRLKAGGKLQTKKMLLLK